MTRSRSTFLARRCGGGTYNREVKRLMLHHIHQFVRTAVFLVGQENHRSRGAMAKVGGVLVERRHRRGNGDVFPDHVVYAIARGAA